MPPPPGRVGSGSPANDSSFSIGRNFPVGRVSVIMGLASGLFSLMSERSLKIVAAVSVITGGLTYFFLRWLQGDDDGYRPQPRRSGGGGGGGNGQLDPNRFSPQQGRGGPPSPAPHQGSNSVSPPIPQPFSSSTTGPHGGDLSSGSRKLTKQTVQEQTPPAAQVSSGSRHAETAHAATSVRVSPTGQHRADLLQDTLDTFLPHAGEYPDMRLPNSHAHSPPLHGSISFTSPPPQRNNEQVSAGSDRNARASFSPPSVSASPPLASQPSEQVSSGSGRNAGASFSPPSVSTLPSLASQPSEQVSSGSKRKVPTSLLPSSVSALLPPASQPSEQVSSGSGRNARTSQPPPSAPAVPSLASQPCEQVASGGRRKPADLPR